MKLRNIVFTILALSLSAFSQTQQAPTTPASVGSPAPGLPDRAAFAQSGMAVSAGVAVAGLQDSPEAREARLAWFKQAKYGMFIHWGLYAIPSGEWKGQQIPGLGEWIMNRAK